MRREQLEGGARPLPKPLESSAASAEPLASRGRIVFSPQGVTGPNIEGPTPAELKEISLEEGAGTTDRLDLAAFPDSTAAYLREIAKTPLLTREQEVKLAKEIEAGRNAKTEMDRQYPDYQDRLQKGEEIPPQAQELAADIRVGNAAKNHLIEANLRLVVSVAKKYAGKGLGLLDLIQEGNFGLMRAVERFDYNRGFKFSTYATWWIRQAVTRGIADQGRTIRLPIHIIEELGRISKASGRLAQSLGREPTAEEIGAKIGLDGGRVSQIIKAASGIVSTDQPAGEYKDGLTMRDFITDPRSLGSPDEETSQIALKVSIATVLKNLTPRERQLVELRFGLIDGCEHTLQEVGQEMGLSKERVRQIEAGALRKLRSSCNRGELQDLR